MTEANLINVPDLVGDIKMVKNETQINGYKACQIRDGAALIKFISWLKDTIDAKDESVTEYEGCVKLSSYRAQQALYEGDSFHTILSTGANGAIIHYHPTKEDSKVLNPNEVILCDSGG